MGGGGRRRGRKGCERARRKRVREGGLVGEEGAAGGVVMREERRIMRGMMVKECWGCEAGGRYGGLRIGGVWGGRAGKLGLFRFVKLDYTRCVGNEEEQIKRKDVSVILAHMRRVEE